jgi:hypothetical protein
MFLPPVEGESWPRYGGDSDGRITSGQPAKRGLTTIAGMSAYSTNMRKLGFHVLNYFNVTEFGADVIFPAPPRHANSDSELWKNANDFLYGKLRDAILYVPDRVNPEAMKRHKGTVANGPYFTWGNGIIMDAGEPVYRDFLIEQGRRHIEKLPDSSGICIDRLDWLRMYNERRDDGVTWFVDRPARSLLSSWRGIMNQLLPLMHSAGKVVFVNNHDKRLDTLKDIDGIFDEFTTNPAALNTTALLCVTRPALGWTNHEKQIRPDPDGLFQRFLYMGVFPMAPYPGNDHSLGPSEWVDRQYLDYGPLMNAMRGRKWVLEPHAAEVPDGTAKANLFAVKDGFVAPVMFGGSRARARVHLRIPGGVRGMEAIHPGSGRAVKVSYRREGSAYIVDVPLVRGCAMVRIQ